MIPIQKKNKVLNFDLFGIVPHLYFQGRQKKGSFLGVFLSFLLILFTTICFFYFGQSLYYRKDANVTVSHAFQAFPEKITIDPILFPVLFELNNPDGSEYHIDPKLVRANVSQLTFKKNEKGSQILEIQSYQMKQCKAEDFQALRGEVRDYFMSKNLSNYFCIPQEVKNLTMQGSFDQGFYQNVKMSFSVCRKNCYSQEEIKERMSIGYAGLYFIDRSFDSANFEDPVKETPHEFFTNFVLDSKKSVNVFFKNSYILSDNGVVFSNIKQDRFFGYDGFQEYNFLQEDSEFFVIYLRVRQESETFSRAYSKLQDLLAQIGGFINVFWIVSRIINLLYARLMFIRDLIFDVFTLKEGNLEREPSEKKQKLPETRKKCVNVFNFENYESSFLFKIPPRNPDVDKIDDVHYSVNSISESQSTKEKEKAIDALSLSFLDYIHYYTGLFRTRERERKKAIIKKGLTILRKNLDVKFIIQKFYEIEKLKYFLLSEQQLESFYQIQRPELIFVRSEAEKRNTVITRLLKKRVSLMEGRESSPSASKWRNLNKKKNYIRGAILFDDEVSGKKVENRK